MKRYRAWKVSEHKAIELDVFRRFPGTVFCIDVHLNLKRNSDHTPSGLILLAVFGWKIVEFGFNDVRHLREE